MVATGITANGGRDVLGLIVDVSEDEVFWRSFLATLKCRGPSEFAACDDEDRRRVAATGPNLPAATAMALADHPDLTTQRLVAANPALPLPKVVALLGDPLVAEAAASNPQLPADFARTLVAAR